MSAYTILRSRLFQHQKEAFDELYSRANTYFRGTWKELPFQSRWHSLIAGPTGSGKTAIAALLAEATNASFLRISAPEWMPAGAHNRAVGETLPIIANHIALSDRAVVFLDELDKIYHQSSWCTYIKGEIFDLLDGRWPVGLRQDNTIECEQDVLKLSEFDPTKLTNSTFFIAAGTFQSFYDFRRKGKPSIGFNTDSDGSVENLTSDKISEHLPRELVNRFDSRIILLPQLEAEDYHALIDHAERQLPDWLRPSFRGAATARLERAISAGSGCRMIEEALADALKTHPNMENPVSPEP